MEDKRDCDPGVYESSEAIASFDSQIKPLQINRFEEQLALAYAQKGIIAIWVMTVKELCPGCNKQPFGVKHRVHLSPATLATFPPFPLRYIDLSNFTNLTQTRTSRLCEQRIGFCRVQHDESMEYVGEHEECIRCSMCNDTGIPGKNSVSGSLWLHSTCRQWLRIHMTNEERRLL